MGENQSKVRNSAHGSIIPARKGHGTKELWFIIPYHSLTCNQIAPGTYPWYDMYARKKKEEREAKHKEGTERRKKGNYTRKWWKHEKRSEHALRAQAEFRGQGCCLGVRSVPWYVQLMDQHKDVTRRRGGRQEDKKMMRDEEPTTKNKRAVLCPVGGSRITQPT